MQSEPEVQVRSAAFRNSSKKKVWHTSECCGVAIPAWVLAVVDIIERALTENGVSMSIIFANLFHEDLFNLKINV